MVAISRTGRLLRRLVRLSCRRPLVTTAISLLLAAAGGTDTLHTLSLGTYALHPPPRPAHPVPPPTSATSRPSPSSSKHGRSRPPSHTRPASSMSCVFPPSS